MTDDRPIIFFDGVCNLCNASVNFVIDRDPSGRFRFAALQSEQARRILEGHPLGGEDLESVVLLEGGKVYRNSAAALRIAKNLSGFWPLLHAFILVPPFLRDAVYRWIARNRYRWFGKSEACRVPTPEIQDRFLR